MLMASSVLSVEHCFGGRILLLDSSERADDLIRAMIGV